MVVDCHHLACVSQSENPNIQKKNLFLKINPKRTIKATYTCMLQLYTANF